MRSSCRVSNYTWNLVELESRPVLGAVQVRWRLLRQSCFQIGRVNFPWVKTIRNIQYLYQVKPCSPSRRSFPAIWTSRDEALRDQGTEALLLSGTPRWGSHGLRSRIRKKHQAEQSSISSPSFPVALSNSHVGGPSFSSNHVHTMARVQ
jgi:hypothetical protein